VNIHRDDWILGAIKTVKERKRSCRRSADTDQQIVTL